MLGKYSATELHPIPALGASLPASSFPESLVEGVLVILACCSLRQKRGDRSTQYLLGKWWLLCTGRPSSHCTQQLWPGL
jgi:hypothetical protein